MLKVWANDVAKNRVESLPTNTGTNVVVNGISTFYNPITQAEEMVETTMTFDNVTRGGETTIIPVSNVAGGVAPRFALEVGGYRAVLFDVVTTAEFTGVVEICGPYPDADNDGLIDGPDGIPETDLFVLHNEGGTFVDRTSRRDTVDNLICAEVTSFSEFAIAVSTPLCCAKPCQPTARRGKTENPCCSSKSRMQARARFCSSWPKRRCLCLRRRWFGFGGPGSLRRVRAVF
ncbi:MAG: hypothetical protein ACI91F_001420 [Candidatus Binatia bacterium]|jgi:hypothetical protein